MPEAEENKQELVDIDTSGPGAEIDVKKRIESYVDVCDQDKDLRSTVVD